MGFAQAGICVLLICKSDIVLFWCLFVLGIVDVGGNADVQSSISSCNGVCL